MALPGVSSLVRNGGDDEDIDVYLRKFNDLFGLRLPVAEKQSPSEKPKTWHQEIVNCVRILYFRNKDALEQTVSELQVLVNGADPSEHYRIVRDGLMRAVEQSGVATPKTARRYHATPSKASSCNDAFRPLPDAPPSPTLAVKRASNKIIDESTLLPPALNASFTSTSVNTSFNSVTNFSISSSPDVAKLSQSTAATSVTGSQTAYHVQSSWAPDDVRQLNTPMLRLQHPVAPATVQSEVKRPALENHRVASIPRDGLIEEDIPTSLHRRPTWLKAEVYRVMRACGLSSEGLSSRLGSSVTMETLRALTNACQVKRFVRGIETDYKKQTLCGELTWSKRTKGRLLDFELRPPRSEKPHDLQRKFGGHRLLVVDVPELDKAPGVQRSPNVLSRVLEMLRQDFHFLGCRWTLLHARKKKDWGLDSDRSCSHVVTYFAISGPSLDTISVLDVCDWALSLRHNLHQFSAKAYARLDLALSRTTATIVFEPENIRFVKDIESNGMLDEGPFDDKEGDFSTPPGQGKAIMTDGCGEISTAAMRNVQLELGLPQMPSALQIRMCGAKGLVGPRPYRTEEDSTQSIVYLRESQRKIFHQDIESDELKRTLNVLDYSKPPRPSQIASSFLPVLANRGVSHTVILDIVREQVELDTKEFLESLEDSRDLRNWVFRHRDINAWRVASQGIPLKAGFPAGRAEKILMMLDHGWEPKTCAYLSKNVLMFAEQTFNLKAKGFRVKSNLCTTVLIAPDPTSSLLPDEVFISFSKPMKDPHTGQVWATLKDLNVLVARNPCIRSSDMQKVRAVLCPALADYHDVLFFSTSGPRSLASKLSGGDYDGDTAWLCWDQRLVEPFKNAPAPWEGQLEKIENFGIIKDRVKLGEALGLVDSAGELKPDGPLSEQVVTEWVQQRTLARFSASLLGTVTRLHEKVTYGGDINSEGARLLADLHNHLVDADKQGYSYTTEAFNEWRAAHAHLIPRHLPKPAHWKFTTRNATSQNDLVAKPIPTDIVDSVYFQVVEPKITTALRRAKILLQDASVRDKHLCATFDDIKNSGGQGAAEAVALLAEVRRLYELWSVDTSRRRPPAETDWTDWDDSVMNLRAALLRYQPRDVGHPAVKEWLRSRGQDMTFWTSLKASALAKHYEDKAGNNGTFMFSIFGAELCRLKAQYCGGLKGSRIVLNHLYFEMKPSKHRVELAQDVEIENLGFADDADDEELFDAEPSLFDDLLLQDLDFISPVKAAVVSETDPPAAKTPASPIAINASAAPATERPTNTTLPVTTRRLRTPSASNPASPENVEESASTVYHDADDTDGADAHKRKSYSSSESDPQDWYDVREDMGLPAEDYMFGEERAKRRRIQRPEWLRARD